MFRKIMATIAIVLFSASVFASQTTLDTRGLSDAQIAELKASAARAVADAAKGGSIPDANEVGKLTEMAATWGTQASIAAEGFARAINIAAKELGVTVNDFLGTDAGKLTAALIIWKVIGDSLLSLFVSLLFLTGGSLLARILYIRLFTKEYKEVQYSRLFGMFKGTKLVRVYKNVSELRGEGEWFIFIIMIVVSILSIILGVMAL